MIAVVDTSALLRLFIPDGPIPGGLEGFMRGVESGDNCLIAPELALVEAINVVAKKSRRSELSKSEANELVTLLQQVPIRYYRHSPIIESAYSLAMETGLSACDALFLALALDHGAPLFTADDKLNKIAANLGLTL